MLIYNDSYRKGQSLSRVDTLRATIWRNTIRGRLMVDRIFQNPPPLDGREGEKFPSIRLASWGW